MSSELATAPVNPGFHKATSMLSDTLGIEPRMMVDTLKRQCFLGLNPDAVSDAQLAAFISVANDLDLNPLLPGMLYAYPGKNGAMVPVTGPDGIFKMLDKRIGAGVLDGYDCTVFPEDMAQKPTHATATIWRKGSDHPSKYTALLSEWQVSSNPNWGSRPRHMLWIRALKQCARQVIHGIPMDEDEVTIADLKNVTPEGDQPAVTRPESPPRKHRGLTAVTQEATVAAGAMPKLTLGDGEKFITEITVEDSGAFAISVNGVPTPSVKAQVAGGFKGLVYHKGGATLVDNKPVLPPMWEKGSKLRVSLVGVLNMMANKDGVLVAGGVLQTFVESATGVPVEAAPAPAEAPLEEF